MRAGFVERLSGSAIAAAAAIALFASLSFVSPAHAVEPGEKLWDESLSSQERLAFAEQSSAWFKTTVNKVLAAVSEAEAVPDLVWLNCLNDKLSQLQGLMSAALSAESELREAIARENGDNALGSYIRATIARDQGQAIALEAEACAGSGGYSSSAGTIVSVTVEGSSEGDEDFGAPTSSGTRPRDSSPDN